MKHPWPISEELRVMAKERESAWGILPWIRQRQARSGYHELEESVPVLSYELEPLSSVTFQDIEYEIRSCFQRRKTTILRGVR